MDPTTADFNAWLAEEGAKIGATVTPQPSNLLAMYGQGYAPADSYDQTTADVLSRMHGGSAIGNLLRSLAPEVRQADDSTAASGILSRLSRTGTGLVHSGLNTAANWLEKRPEIGPDTLAPLGLAPMGMALTPRNAVGVFGGQLAKTADHAALAKAQEMTAKGMPREDIWKDTGWFQGRDGKWRFEIDDSRGHITNDANAAVEYTRERGSYDPDAPPSLGYPLGGQAPGYEGPLSGGFRHSPLYDAYPSMRDEPLSLTKGEIEGYHARVKDQSQYHARADDPATRRSVLLHELQHGVQEREGFDRTLPVNPGPKTKQAMRDVIAAQDSYYASTKPRSLWQRMFGPEPPKGATREDIKRLSDDLDRTAQEEYRRQAAEVDARTVQARRDLSAEQRRARPPWLDYDVPESQQIVHRRNNLLSDQSRASVPGTLINAMDLEKAKPVSSDAAKPTYRDHALAQGKDDLYSQSPLNDIVEWMTTAGKNQSVDDFKKRMAAALDYLAGKSPSGMVHADNARASVPGTVVNAQEDEDKKKRKK